MGMDVAVRVLMGFSCKWPATPIFFEVSILLEIQSVARLLW